RNEILLRLRSTKIRRLQPGSTCRRVPDDCGKRSWPRTLPIAPSLIDEVSYGHSHGTLFMSLLLGMPQRCGGESEQEKRRHDHIHGQCCAARKIGVRAHTT